MYRGRVHTMLGFGNVCRYFHVWREDTCREKISKKKKCLNNLNCTIIRYEMKGMRPYGAFNQISIEANDQPWRDTFLWDTPSLNLRNLIGQHALYNWLQEVSIKTPRISRTLASYRAQNVSEPLVQVYDKIQNWVSRTWSLFFHLPHKRSTMR